MSTSDSTDDPLFRLLERSYAPEEFRRSAHRIVDLLADFLSESQGALGQPVIPWLPPNEAKDRWALDREVPNMEQLTSELLNDSIRLHDPRYLGHQINPAAPIAALAGLVVDTLDNGMGVYEMGMAGTAIERNVTQALARQFGMAGDAGGFFTSGGTLGNLTALLTARSIHLANSQTNNTEHPSSSQRLCVLTSEASHYCIQRATYVMGQGDDGVIPVPCDDSFRMQPGQLEACYEQAVQSGRTVFAVVGSACTTSTGAFDPLDAIADFCHSRSLWFHVDGAHGAAAAFSKKYRYRLAGIERADSVVMDFHKLLMTPAITTAVVYRRWEDGLATFANEADYLWSRNQIEIDWYTLAKRTFECTKSMMAFKVYTLWMLHGVALFDANVTRLFDLTSRFAELIKQHGRYELAHDPTANIICFRHLFPDHDASRRSDLNAQLRTQLIQSGNYYIVQTVLHGEIWLRCTVANALTTEAHLTGLLDELDRMARMRDAPTP